MPGAGRRVDSLSVLAAQAFLDGLHGTMYLAIWQPFVLSLGASMSELGLLGSLGGYGGLIPTLIQPLGGWWADRSGRKRVLVLAELVTTVGFLLALVAGAGGWAWLLVPSIMVLGLAFVSRPAASALTAESVAEHRRGSAFSLLQFSRMLPGIVAPALAGVLADRLGYSVVWGFLAGIALVAAGFLIRMLRETRPGPRPQARWSEARAVLFRAILPPSRLRAFFVAVALDSFAWGLGWGILPGMLARTFGYTPAQLGLLLSVQSLVWAAIQIPVGRYIDRHGTRLVLILSEASGIPLMLLWMTANSFEWFVVSQALFAITAATWIPVTSTFLSKQIEDHERAEVFGRLSAFRGLIGFLAPFLGGLLYDGYGMRAPLLANLAGVVLVVTVLVWFVREHPRPALACD